MTPQLKKTQKSILLSVTSLYLFGKKISHGNDFLPIIEILIKNREKDDSGHFGISFAACGEASCQRQADCTELWKLKRCFKLIKCVRLHLIKNNSGFTIARYMDFKIPACNKTTTVNDLINSLRQRICNLTVWCFNKQDVWRKIRPIYSLQNTRL